ncbi:hypothetical protein PQX77_016181 [Marasmius sp. AFHP31]|nr:hypothetical protein PQX77_016181 [Marasmius sp. AFHP31]
MQRDYLLNLLCSSIEYLIRGPLLFAEVNESCLYMVEASFGFVDHKEKINNAEECGTFPLEMVKISRDYSADCAARLLRPNKGVEC